MATAEPHRAGTHNAPPPDGKARNDHLQSGADPYLAGSVTGSLGFYGMHVQSQMHLVTGHKKAWEGHRIDHRAGAGGTGWTRNRWMALPSTLLLEGLYLEGHYLLDAEIAAETTAC
jgi:hypothetical protein